MVKLAIKFKGSDVKWEVRDRPEYKDANFLWLHTGCPTHYLKLRWQEINHLNFLPSRVAKDKNEK